MYGCIIDRQGMNMFAVTIILMISNSMVSGQQCAPNCISCTEFSKCTECKGGFYNGYWKNGSNWLWRFDCPECQEECEKCSSYHNCTECKDGFYNGYWHDGSKWVRRFDCPKCQEGCEKCSSYSNCTSCKPGRCSDGNKQTCNSNCTHSNCERCSACDVCVSCKRWYYGKTCESRCENGCKETCDMNNGNCNCRANYKGLRCSECTDGKYGSNCERDCPANCAGNSCDQVTGRCLNRCSGNDGRCKECPEGKHGLNCQSDCPAGCLGNKCDKETGSCTNGCENGFKASCTECKDGFHGERCQACPENCLTCHSADNCTECIQGYWGQTCKQRCPHLCVTCDTKALCIKCRTGFYGKTCSLECHEKCAGRLCRKEDGYCDSCQSGWWGNKCNHNCSPGCKDRTCDREGTCEMDCTNNIGSKCDRCSEGYYGNNCLKCPSGCMQCVSNNNCTKCQKGRYGHTCQSFCPPGCVNGQCNADGSCIACNEGYFGERCDRKCSSNCKGNCIKTTGQCRSCTDGLYGDVCSETCPSNCLKCSSKTECTACRTGYKGPSCSDECSNCKNGTGCGQSDGICNLACADGLTGISCNESCPSVCKTCDRKNKKCTSCLHEKYGVLVRGSSKYLSCHLNCSDACVDHACNEKSGRCTVDCNKGHWGENCDKSCSEKCKLNTCERKTGFCIGGCKNGFFGTKCEYECPEHCANGVCDYTYGTCTEGCVIGFYGSQCTYHCDFLDRNCLDCIDDRNYRYRGCTKCKHGFYVTNEKNKCRKCPTWCKGGDCHPATGTCEHGCQEGRWGVKCEKHCSEYCSTCNQTDGRCLACVSGRHGQDCSNECTADCAGGCNKKTGQCASGCKENDKYGKYCEKECGLNCLSGRCDWSSGVCSDGCVQGFHGDMCEDMCSNNCRNNSCSRPTGECIMGCKDGYEGEFCSEEIGGSEMNDVIAAGCAGIVGLIIIGILAVILYHRHQKRREPDTGDNQLPVPGHISPPAPQDGAVRPPASTGDTVYANIDATSDDLSVAIEIVEEDENELTGSLPVVPTNTQAPIHPSLQDGENTYYNLDALLERKVALEKLREFVSNKSEVDFLTEFKDLPVGLIKPYSESQKSDNRAKNRYRGVYPYDTNRVVTKSGSEDYINASYIQGYKTRNAYIASIGPTIKHMGEDFAIFWKMVWQEKVTRIVMLTNLRELGVQKCDQYWPDVGSERFFGNVSVKCEQEDDKTHFTIRTFIVKNTKKGDEARTLCQYHFTSWPDKGIPDSVKLLTEFHKQSQDDRVDLGSEAPLIVHCSAGVGRTGTFIALDILTNEGRAEGHVDIYACVRNLREERVNMVQTLEQYKYLHGCVVETIAT